jgi:hypothetical protein
MKTKHIVIGIVLIGAAYLAWKKFSGPKATPPIAPTDINRIEGVKQ